MSKVSPSNPPLFEHVACSRCGGSGNYSYNSLHGTRCYGCGGSGWKLTKRGRAAQDYLDTLRSKRAEDLQPGDKIREYIDINRIGWCTVLSVVPSSSSGGVDIVTDRVRLNGWDAHKLMRVAQTAERVAEIRAAALAYQATLTKNGTPSKRAA